MIFFWSTLFNFAYLWKVGCAFGSRSNIWMSNLTLDRLLGAEPIQNEILANINESFFLINTTATPFGKSSYFINGGWSFVIIKPALL